MTDNPFFMDADIQNEKHELELQLRAKYHEIQTLHESLEQQLGCLIQPLNDKIEQYNELCTQAELVVGQAVKQFNEEFNDLSEEVQESDRGVRVEVWIEDFERFEATQLDEIEINLPHLDDDCQTATDLEDLHEVYRG